VRYQKWDIFCEVGKNLNGQNKVIVSQEQLPSDLRFCLQFNISAGSTDSSATTHCCHLVPCRASRSSTHAKYVPYQPATATDFQWFFRCGSQWQHRPCSYQHNPFWLTPSSPLKFVQSSAVIIVSLTYFRHEVPVLLLFYAYGLMDLDSICLLVKRTARFPDVFIVFIFCFHMINISGAGLPLTI
jgi:hypothetical protein